MKKKLSVWIFLFLSLSLVQGASIVPKPCLMEEKGGYFELNSKTSIHGNDVRVSRYAAFLNEFCTTYCGMSLSVREKAKPGKGINFVLVENFEDEAYELDIDPNAITIRGNLSGLFYGLQSLLQLIPVESSVPIRLPCLTIKDKPRFAYRGAMLDCGRYFFTIEEVKRFLDLMAHYKLNKFHWHLTEDAGWRIEIKKYPLLTEVGAWRRGTQKNHSIQSSDRIPHGGYYTQEEIRELVVYARERNITIIPEIDMPGHMLALLAAYPEVSCTGGPFRVLEHWGIQKDVLCAGNEKTYQMMEDILDEVIDLFPSDLIHIGGDEAPKDNWKACRHCQAKIQQENLNNEEELQSYFIKRIGAYLLSKGRKMIGWDEMMEGGLAPQAMVMSWRGEEGGIRASGLQHEVVMAPNSFMYLDYYQGAEESEPFCIGGFLPLEKVYSYEPLSEKISEENRQYIVGVQGNLWMEFIHSQSKLDYMAFPRLLAVAEVAWSRKDAKDYSDFRERLKSNLLWLEKKNVNLRIPDPVMSFEHDPAAETLRISMQEPIEGARIYYTFNEDDPLIEGRLYTAPLELNTSGRETVELRYVVKTKAGRVSNERKETCFVRPRLPYSQLAAPDTVGNWIVPAQGKASIPLWGHKKGILLGIAPTPGPRGLIRIYCPYLGLDKYNVMNFIAFEPVPEGASERGYSELEVSSLDPGKHGKRFWSANDSLCTLPRNEQFPARGVISRINGDEVLTFFVFSEAFDNGAKVYTRLRLFASRPYEFEITCYTYDGSVSLDHFIVTATMGNKARLRNLFLKNETRSSLAIWPDYKGIHFTERVSISSDEMLRDSQGNTYFIAAPDEKDYSKAEYYPSTQQHWRYKGKHATQYWMKKQATRELTGIVSGRYTYWASQDPIPGGISFENVELNEPFNEGNSYIFAIVPEEAESLIRRLTGKKK